MKTIKQITNAKEAIQLTSENSASLKEVKEEIYRSALSGNNFCIIIKIVPTKVQAELMNLGFSIGVHTDMINISNFKVSW